MLGGPRVSTQRPRLYTAPEVDGEAPLMTEWKSGTSGLLSTE